MDLGDVAVVSDYYAQNGYYTIDNVGPSGYGRILIASESITFTGRVKIDSDSDVDEEYRTFCVFDAPKIIFNNLNSSVGIQIRKNNNNKITFNNASVNFDNAKYSIYYRTVEAYRGDIEFTGTSSINITSNTNGKTIIYSRNLTGTITLDVGSGVQDGDTFLIDATDNQLTITDPTGWTITPSTVGNVTTYTLAKSGPKRKFRLLYTIDGGNKKLRFLGSKE